MNQASKFELSINEALSQVNLSELLKELEVEDKYVRNYLNQLITNINQEISPGIFVVPFNYGHNLTIFIEHYNQIVLSKWLQGYRKKYYKFASVKELINKILHDYDKFDQIVQIFEQEKLLKFKDLIYTVLTVQLEDKFKENKFQVAKNLFLIKIGREPELRPFYTILNQELASEAIPSSLISTYAEKPVPSDVYIDLVEDFSTSAQKLEKCKTEHNNDSAQSQQEFLSILVRFIKGLKLKEGPDNKQKILRYSEKSRIQHQKTRKVFIGIFEDCNHCQTFKIFRNLSNELFEIEQFMDYCNERKEKLDNFEIDTFVKLFQYPCEIKDQQNLTDILIRQLEFTRINMREAKEHFYKTIFVNYSELDFLKETQWGRDFFLRNDHRRNPKPKKFKKNYEYIAKIENSRFFWRDSIYKMLEQLKQMYNKEKTVKNSQNAFIYYQMMYRIAVIQMQFESDYLFGILQEYQNQCEQNKK